MIESVLANRHEQLIGAAITPASPAHPDEKIMTGGPCIEKDEFR